MNRYALRSLNANTHVLTLHAYDGHYHVVSNHDRLANSPRQYQHGNTSLYVPIPTPYRARRGRFHNYYMLASLEEAARSMTPQKVSARRKAINKICQPRNSARTDVKKLNRSRSSLAHQR